MNDRENPRGSHFPLTNNSTPSSPQPAGKNAPKRPSRRPRTIWTYLKWISVTCLCLMTMAFGVLVAMFSRNDMVRTVMKSAMTNPWVTATHPFDPLATFKPEYKFEGTDQHVFNLAVFGCDVDYEDGRPIPIKDSRGRSDAILLARINFDEQTIHVISIPRDTACRIPDHGLHKINAAIAFGGPELATRTIENTFGIHIDHFIVLNFFGFQKMVDAVGGVDLDVEKKLDYDDNWGHLHVHLKPGYQHLSGYKAMGYVRMRHSDSDLMRSERQHKFLEAVREEVYSPSNFMKLPDALSAITDSIHTDLNNDKLLTIANFARTLPKERISLVTLPVIEGPSYVYVKVRESEEMLQKIFSPYGEPISINVPGYDIVRGMEGSHSGRRSRRKHGAKATATTPKAGDAEPTLAPPDDTIPAPDDSTTKDTPSSGESDTDKSGMPHNGDDSGKKQDDSGDSGKKKDDSGKTGGDSDSKDKAPAEPTAPPASPGADKDQHV